MPEQLDHLIQRLREMDYSAWSKIDTVIREHLIMTPSGPDHLADWIISGCIQDAIAARVGWGYSVDCLGNRDDECRYCGLIVGPNTDTDDLEDGWIRVAKASTPATALLAAYIAAREAEREAGR